MKMTAENTLRAYRLVLDGTASVQELADSWGIARETIYGAFARYDKPLRLGPSPEEHIELQQQSGTPPEVYAARAGIQTATLRQYAYLHEQQLGLRLHSEAKQWWTEKLRTLRPQHLQHFCIQENLPVHLVAKWFHLINKPPATLLWGFSELREVTCDMFNDVGRFHNQHAPTHVLGRGRSVSSVDARVATEAYKHSRACDYQSDL